MQWPKQLLSFGRVNLSLSDASISVIDYVRQMQNEPERKEDMHLFSRTCYKIIIFLKMDLLSLRFCNNVITKTNRKLSNHLDVCLPWISCDFKSKFEASLNEDQLNRRPRFSYLLLLTKLVSHPPLREVPSSSTSSSAPSKM